MSRTSWMVAFGLAGTLALCGAAQVAGQAAAPAAAPAAPQPDPLPPPIAYRVSIMQGMAAHSGAIRGIVDGGAGDPTHTLDHATSLVQLSLMAGTIFPAGTGGERSRARDEIWQNPAEFKTRMDALQSATTALLQSAYSGDRERIRDSAVTLQQSCAGCHRQFRKPATN